MQQIFQVIDLSNGAYQIHFDLPNSSVNVLNDEVYQQLNLALDEVEAKTDLATVIFTSGKSVFIAGADIPMLLANAKQSEEHIVKMLSLGHDTFNRMQALRCVTVSCINGFALGGGLEFTLATDIRVMARTAKLGVPEVSLGVFPGWGGTTRLPRMIEPETAVQWVTSGAPQNADSAYQAGLVSQVVETPEQLLEAALEQAKHCDTTAIRQAKSAPVKLSDASREAIDKISAGLAKRPGKNYPAGSAALNSMLSQFDLPLSEANQIELQDFAKLLRTDTAINLLSVFLNDQAASKAARTTAKGAEAVEQCAVIGAGIMGGGIAYQSSLKKIPVVMKDIQEQALELGMQEAKTNFSAMVKRGRMSEADMSIALERIEATLDNDKLNNVDIVVEAVVELTDVKKVVLADLENQVRDDAILASNTSTISITRLAEDLQRPENFCGMHFFNPVPLMPLVEIIRGKQTSDATIAKTVNYALQLGKKPVVVNDCPAFLVNRVLFPYMNAGHLLFNEGVDFQQVDKVMEQWGWPMGPAFLSDVIGMDTMCHCMDVLAKDIPERMAMDFTTAAHTLYENERLGQKNGVGYYKFIKNEKGRMEKQVDETAYKLLYKNDTIELDTEQIEQRMMIAICLEMVRCLEENIVASPAEADMALLWGIGFPRFRGGGFRYIDTIGVDKFCAQAEQYADLGAMYHIPQLLLDMRNKGDTFYG